MAAEEQLAAELDHAQRLVAAGWAQAALAVHHESLDLSVARAAFAVDGGEFANALAA